MYQNKPLYLQLQSRQRRHRAKCQQRGGYKTGGQCRQRPCLQPQTKNKTGIPIPNNAAGSAGRIAPGKQAMTSCPCSLTYCYTYCAIVYPPRPQMMAPKTQNPTPKGEIPYAQKPCFTVQRGGGHFG